MTVSWSPEVKERAQKEGLYLAKIILNGRHASTPPIPGSTMELSTDLSEDDAHILIYLFLSKVNDDGAKGIEPRTKAAIIKAFRQALNVLEPESRSDLTKGRL